MAVRECDAGNAPGGRVIEFVIAGPK